MQRDAGNPMNGNAMNLLEGDNLFIDLDDKTLQCLVGGMPLPAISDDSGAGPSNPKHKGFYESWIPDDIGQQQGCGGQASSEREGSKNEVKCCRDGKEESTADEDGDQKNCQTNCRLGKRGRPMSDAAASKAVREKARRERLNQYFDELACACGEKGVKNDRASIIVDAIRVVKQLRVEVNQLRQLNKFLEERTTVLERERAQYMFQNYGSQMTSMNGHIPSMGMHIGEMHGSARPPSSVTMHQKYEMGNTTGSGMGQAPAMRASDQHTWLPASNIIEDEKLRPPAA